MPDECVWRGVVLQSAHKGCDMDDAAIGRLDAAIQAYARWRAVSDPAIEPCDLVQAAWVRVLPVLADVATEEERIGLLKWAIANAALDLRRKAARRPLREPLTDEHPGGVRVDDQALACVMLGPVLAQAQAGDRRSLALVALGLGYSWSAVKAALSVGAGTLLRWHGERAAVVEG